MRIRDWSSDGCSADLDPQFDVRTVDQRLGNIEPAVHHVRIADVEAGDGERLGRVLAFGHAGDDAIVDRSADRQRLEGRTEFVEVVRSEEHTSELQYPMRISDAVSGSIHNTLAPHTH